MNAKERAALRSVIRETKVPLSAAEVIEVAEAVERFVHPKPSLAARLIGGVLAWLLVAGVAGLLALAVTALFKAVVS